MPGMNSGLNINDPAVVAAFRSALLHQGIAALLIFAVLSVAWVAVRDWRAGEAGPGQAGAGAAARGGEPAGRRVLRIGFGLLWLLDGILQAQPGMAVGLPSQVIEPTAASSPHWVQHLVNWAGTTWSYHPVQAGGGGAVWIQVGIGLWLLFAAPRARCRGWPGVASVGWGLVVWVFGESFGGVLAPGPELADRGARRGGVLLRGRGADRAARPGRGPAPRLGPGAAGRDGRVPGRDGGAAGVAGPRLLAGQRARASPAR